MPRKRNYNKWTEEETNALLALVGEHSFAEVVALHAETTGRTPVSVESKLRLLLKKGVLTKEQLGIEPKKRWTTKEVATLEKIIGKNPGNFTEGFRICANKTGKSVNAVNRKFSRLRSQGKLGVCSMNVGKTKAVSVNRKNVYSKTGGTTTAIKESKFRRILKILFE